MRTYSTSPHFSKREEITCPLCNTSNKKVYWNCRDYYFVKCKKCGFIYQNKQPLFEELKEHYDENYAAYELENEANFSSLALKGLRDISFFCDYAPRLSEKTVLDVGCATGAVLNEFAKRGFKPLGIEVDQHSAQLAKERYNIEAITKPIEHANLPNASIEVIHTSHVIEHVKDPVFFITECNRILKKNGYLILTTPNTASLQAKYFQTTWRSSISDHLCLFNKKNLRRTLEANKFTILNEKTWGGWAAGNKPALLKKPLDSLAKKWGFGDVMLFFCQKQ